MIKMKTIGSSIGAFFGKPASPRPLEVLRVLLAAILLVQALMILPSIDALHGEDGLIQGTIMDALTYDYLPRVGWFSDALGISPTWALRGVFALYVFSLLGLLMGGWTRASIIGAWFLHLTLKMSGTVSAYGVDEFANFALFYLMFMPIGTQNAWEVLRGRRVGPATPAARLSIRVLQLQMCLVYLSAGIEKARGAQWWNGEAIWRALNEPDLAQFDFSWLADFPILAMLLCWGTLLVEIGYAVFMWIPKTRKLWLLATIGLHAGIAVAMTLHSFSAIMTVLTIAAFGISYEVKRKKEEAAIVRPAPALTS